MKRLSTFFLLIALLFTSCGKDENTDSAGHIVVKGTNKLIVSVMHHSMALPGIRVYLKNNAVEFPGTDVGVYDWHTQSDNSGIASFENLFQGNYFLYAEGFDQNVGMNVMGATPAVINSSTVSGNELYVTLYVTE